MIDNYRHDATKTKNTDKEAQTHKTRDERDVKFKKSTNRHVHSICHQFFWDEAYMIEIGYNLFVQDFFQHTRSKSRTYVLHKERNVSIMI